MLQHALFITRQTHKAYQSSNIKSVRLISDYRPYAKHEVLGHCSFIQHDVFGRRRHQTAGCYSKARLNATENLIPLPIRLYAEAKINVTSFLLVLFLISWRRFSAIRIVFYVTTLSHERAYVVGEMKDHTIRNHLGSSIQQTEFYESFSAFALALRTAVSRLLLDRLTNVMRLGYFSDFRALKFIKALQKPMYTISGTSAQREPLYVCWEHIQERGYNVMRGSQIGTDAVGRRDYINGSATPSLLYVYHSTFLCVNPCLSLWRPSLKHLFSSISLPKNGRMFHSGTECRSQDYDSLGEVGLSKDATKTEISRLDEQDLVSNSSNLNLWSPAPDIQSTERFHLFYPNTREELVQLLLKALLHNKPMPLPELLVLHDEFTSLHSTRSYNIIIQLCISHSAFGTAKRLFESMRVHNIPQNTETRILSTRWMVRTGLISMAWYAMRQSIRHNGRIPPLRLLLEFLDEAQAGAFSPETQRVLVGNSKINDTSSPDISSTTDIHREVLSLVLAVLSKEKISEYAIFVIVRMLLRSGRGHIARSLTKEWVSTLPLRPRPSQSLARRRLDILHLHLQHAQLSNTRDHFRARRLVMRCLRIGDMRPTADTLYLLLRSIRMLNHARTLISTMTKRWGRYVVDRRVRRRLTELKLRDGRVTAVNRALQIEEKTEQDRISTMPCSSAKEVASGHVSKERLDRYYPGNGKETLKWQSLRAKLVQHMKPK